MFGECVGCKDFGFRLEYKIYVDFIFDILGRVSGFWRFWVEFLMIYSLVNLKSNWYVLGVILDC